MKFFEPKPNCTLVIGFLLIVCFFLLLFVSESFENAVPIVEKPVLILVVLLFLSSVFYLLSVKFGKVFNSVLLIFLVGLVIRVVTVFSFPILEDDYFRYLWDGAVTASGINPYGYSPQDVILNGEINPELRKLAVKSGDVIDSINHPHLRTIYPPVSQFFFALSYKIAPWNLYTFKFILLFFDITVFFLLIRVLEELDIPISSSIIYWWNPLLVKEIFNSAHFEVIAFPFLLVALIMVLRKKFVVSSVSLAISAGVKIWPVLLLPLILKYLFKDPLKLIKTALLFLAAFAIIFLPLFIAGFDSSSGYFAYLQSWENNSSLFRVFLFCFEFIFSSINIHPGHAQRYTRIFVALLIIFWILYQTYKMNSSSGDLFKRVLYVVAGVFLLIPTQFPWYYVWLIPFLAINPRWSLLLLTLLLPLYYTRYYFEPREKLDLFYNVVVWVEFVPVWILLIVEWRKGKFLRRIYEFFYFR